MTTTENIVTYRLGKNMHYPAEKNGSELKEHIKHGDFSSWLDETEMKLGPISVIDLKCVKGGSK